MEEDLIEILFPSPKKKAPRESPRWVRNQSCPHCGEPEITHKQSGNTYACGFSSVGNKTKTPCKFHPDA
jgi:hypothetical protein